LRNARIAGGAIHGHDYATKPRNPFRIEVMKPALVAGLTLAVVFVPGAGSTAMAQDPGNGGGVTQVRLVPRVGLLSPDRYLYEQFANLSGDGPVEWTDGYLRRALVVGLGVEVGRPTAGVALRGEVIRSFGGWMSVAHSIVVPRQVFDPPYVETTWLDVPTSVMTGSLQVILPLRLRIRGSQPYVVAGVHGRRYGFDEPTSANEVEAILPANGVTWGGDVGAGFTIPFRRLAIDVQGRDSISRYWGKIQHDLVFSTGLIWRVR
jgi:hypothetical protein